MPLFGENYFEKPFLDIKTSPVSQGSNGQHGRKTTQERVSWDHSNHTTQEDKTLKIYMNMKSLKAILMLFESRECKNAKIEIEALRRASYGMDSRVFFGLYFKSLQLGGSFKKLFWHELCKTLKNRTNESLTLAQMLGGLKEVECVGYFEVLERFQQGFATVFSSEMTWGELVFIGKCWRAWQCNFCVDTCSTCAYLIPQRRCHVVVLSSSDLESKLNFWTI